MKKFQFNILKKFNEDLKAAVIFDAKSPLNKNTKSKLFFGLFLISYILSKPFYIYYTNYLLRLKKIEQLKKEGKFIIADEV